MRGVGLYATVTNGVCTEITDYDTPPSGLVGPLEGITPQPEVGWAYDGTTWTPSAAYQARQQLGPFIQAIPGYITQAQADLTTMQGLQAGQPLTAAQVAVLNNWAKGWVTLLQALQVLMTSMG
jgi:hypothetical protein